MQWIWSQEHISGLIKGWFCTNKLNIFPSCLMSVSNTNKFKYCINDKKYVYIWIRYQPFSSSSVVKHNSDLNSYPNFLFHRDIHDVMTCTETPNRLLSKQCCATVQSFITSYRQLPAAWGANCKKKCGYCSPKLK